MQRYLTAHPYASVQVLDQVGSTNALLLTAPDRFPHGTVLIAEEQTAGRGRRGRTWVSPRGLNVYMSIAYRWHSPFERLQGLSLAIGVALAEALESNGARDVAVKWPNDVLLGGAKSCGILVETRTRATGVTDVVVGTGINVHTPADGASVYAPVEQAWTALDAHVPKTPDRSVVAGAAASRVLACIEQFETGGLAAFAERWRRFDVLYGRAVRAGDIDGTAAGVDAAGHLQIDTRTGVQAVAAGEVSVRLVD
ncbi:MAG: biotin--[acetyl-CoA-carboxylase] ligase [Pseudomonadota bacterium]